MYCAAAGGSASSTLHSKVVLSTTAVLILGGAMLLWLTEPISFLAALFQSITTRTAGFSTIDIGAMTNAGLLVIMILMFIGASPGSTGGGIKTTTFFVLMQEVRIIFSKRRLGAFRRRLPEESLAKAATITLLGTIVVFVGTFMLLRAGAASAVLCSCCLSGFSAYSTAGLSMGITSSLHAASKAVLIVTMFIGRVRALHAAVPLGLPPGAQRQIYRRSHYDRVIYPERPPLQGGLPRSGWGETLPKVQLW